jgi:hypothetical protein
VTAQETRESVLRHRLSFSLRGTPTPGKGIALNVADFSRVGTHHPQNIGRDQCGRFGRL